MLDNGSENEFAFSCSIARVHNLRDAFVFQEFFDGGQLAFVTAPLWFVFKFRGDVGEPVDGFSPIFEGFIVLIHEFEFQQMANSPGDDDVLAVPVGVGFFAHSQHVRQVFCNAGFLGDDDDGHDVEAHRQPYLNPPLC